MKREGILFLFFKEKKGAKVVIAAVVGITVKVVTAVKVGAARAI